MSSWIKH